MQQLKPDQKMLEVIWEQGPGDNALEQMDRRIRHTTSKTRNRWSNGNALDEYN